MGKVGGGNGNNGKDGNNGRKGRVPSVVGETAGGTRITRQVLGWGRVVVVGLETEVGTDVELVVSILQFVEGESVDDPFHLHNYKRIALLRRNLGLIPRLRCRKAFE